MRRSTRIALLAYRTAQAPERRTYVKMVADLGLLPADTGLLSDVLHQPDHVAPARENRLRRALGLPTGRAPRATIQVQPATRALLRTLRQDGESFDATIRRLCEKHDDQLQNCQ
jgi:hypothetical protein